MCICGVRLCPIYRAGKAAPRVARMICSQARSNQPLIVLVLNNGSLISQVQLRSEEGKKLTFQSPL